jgi:hypothetical protein
MSTRTQFVVAALFIFFFAAPVASAALLSLGVEPLVGYEIEQRTDPTAHTHGHLIYGARATVGIPFLTGEVEFLHSQDSETFSNVSTQDVENKFKAGLRATFNLTYFLTFALRAGVEYATDQHGDIANGTTTPTTTQTYLPYGGAGLKLWINRRMALTAEAVGVATSFPNMNLNNYQFTGGLLVRFP